MADETTRVLQFEFRDYFDVIRRRKWTVIFAVIVVCATGTFLSVREQKVYRASAEMLIDTVDETTTGGTAARPDLTTETRLLQSQAVRARAVKEEPRLGSVAGRAVGNRVLEVSVEDIDPRLAASSVNAYVSAYTDYRREQMINRLLDAAEQTQAKIDALGSEVTELNAQLQQQLEEVQDRYAPSAADSPTAAARKAQDLQREQSAIEDSLKPRRDSFQRQQILLEQTLQDLQIKAQRAAQTLQVITPPVEPTTPVRPKPVQDGIKAFGMGLVLGILLAFLFEYLDDSIQTREDVQRAVGVDIPVVGVIPTAESKDAQASVITLMSPKSPNAEAYRSLRTSVHFLGLEEPLTTLAITSPSVGEGKSTTLANLAVVMAQSGQRVVILDCDLRRPRIHHFFGLRNDVGFTSVLMGEAPLSVALQQVPDINRLALLASGPIPPNPSELLTSTRFRDVLRLLKSDDAVVLIDTPPVLPVTDAAVIAASCDKILLVASAGKSTRRQIRNTLDLLRQVDAPLAGVVLNRVESSRREGYYQYYYSASDGRGAAPRTRVNGAGSADVRVLPSAYQEPPARPRRRSRG